MSLHYNSMKPDEGRCTLEQWVQKVKVIEAEMPQRRSDCFDKRNASRWMRYDTTITKAWSAYYNAVKLSDRIYATKVLCNFLKTFEAIISIEKKQLGEEKDETELLLESSDSWTKLAINCLNIRDAKRGCDATIDIVTQELNNEVKLCQEYLMKMAKLAAQLMATMQEFIKVETALKLDQEFKTEAADLDITCLEISPKDSIGYKVDVLADPKQIISLEEWYARSMKNVNKLKEECHKSAKQRMETWHTRETFKNLYNEQADKTEYEMRKRIYEYNVQKNELQFQVYMIDDMLAKSLGELKRMQALLTDVIDGLKCAESKAAARYLRKGDETTRDEPAVSIKEEVVLLRTKEEECKKKVDELTALCKKLEDDKYRINLELLNKYEALRMELQVYDLRMAARPGFFPKAILTQPFKQQLTVEIEVP